jgi:hypothetical protein
MSLLLLFNKTSKKAVAIFKKAVATPKKAVAPIQTAAILVGWLKTVSKDDNGTGIVVD